MYSIHVNGQFTPVDSVEFERITAASMDSRGTLYLGFESGNVARLDQQLAVEEFYSPDRPSKVSLLEAANGLRIFVNYADLQEYLLLDRFLTESARYSLMDFTAFGGVAAPSQENTAWIFDIQSFSIQKVDPLINQVSFTIPLEQIVNRGSFEITHMREYQNLLIVADRSQGIFIFDNMGSLLDRIPLPGVAYFSFFKEELIASTENKMIVYNLYTTESSQYILPRSATMVFKTNEALFIIQENAVIRCLQK